jgi:hypothetical protein
VMFDSMMPLDDGVITKYSPIKYQQVSIWNSSENPKIKNPDFTPFWIIQNLRKF